MANSVDRVKHDYYGYPEAREGPHSEYQNILQANPVLRGTPLAIAATAVMNIGPLAGFLWSNAGFTSVRKIKDLDRYECRYEPIVIPDREARDHGGGTNGFASVPYQGAPHERHRHMNVASYHNAYRNGQLTPTAVARALLTVIEGSSSHQAAFLAIERDIVFAQAEASEARYKSGKPISILDGVPVAVKDEVDLANHKKTLGTTRDFTDPRNITSWCVQKWADAGAIIIGKTNMHEMGLDTTNNNPYTSTPLNPHNSSYYTGGSSGGSAYAVSAGLIPIALGVDGGGSIRVPAAYCGLYGLKTSHGRVSYHPSVNVATSNSVSGPIASSMADLELAYRVMATPNPADPRSSLFPDTIPVRPISANNKEPKYIGIFTPWFDSADAEVLNACHNALDYYKANDYTIIPIEIPHLVAGQSAHAMTIMAEIVSGLPRSTWSSFQPSLRLLMSVGAQTPACDLMLAQRLRNLLMCHLAHLWRTYPGMLIVTPTTPNAGWHIAGGAAELKGGISDANMSLRSMTYVWLANFTGCPAITVPVGMVQGVDKSSDRERSSEGTVPVGLMAMAEWGEEERCLEWGRVAEAWAWQRDGGGMVKAKGWVDVCEGL